MKLCKKCTHCYLGAYCTVGVPRERWRNHGTSVVTGRKYSTINREEITYCMTARKHPWRGGSCGPEARFFEPKRKAWPKIGKFFIDVFKGWHTGVPY